MSILIATRVFYSYKGYSEDGQLLSFGDGQVERNELIDSEVGVYCLKIAQKHNKRVSTIHLIAVTPLDFEIV